MIKNYNTARKGIGNEFYLLANINLLLEDSKEPQKNHHIEEFNKNVLEKVEKFMEDCRMSAEKVKNDIEINQKNLERTKALNLDKVNTLPEDCVNRILSYIPDEMEMVRKLTVMEKYQTLSYQSSLNCLNKIELYSIMRKSIPNYVKRFDFVTWRDQYYLNSCIDKYNNHRKLDIVQLLEQKLFYAEIYKLLRVRVDSLCQNQTLLRILDKRFIFSHYKDSRQKAKYLYHDLSYAYNLYLLFKVYRTYKIKQKYAVKTKILQISMEKELLKI